MVFGIWGIFCSYNQVYVKKLPPVRLMQQIRDAGVLQIVDPLDNYRWREVRRCVPFTDHFLAANQTHRAYLMREFGVPAVVIPHHHCNPDEVRIPPGREPPSRAWRCRARLQHGPACPPWPCECAQSPVAPS